MQSSAFDIEHNTEGILEALGESMPEKYLGHIYMDSSDNNLVEYHVTVNPDPKRRHLGKQWSCMTPRRQHRSLCYSIHHFIHKCFRSKIQYYRFIFELGTNGNVHTHGTIIIEGCPANTHMINVKSFIRQICEYYGRSINNEMLMRACCMIRPKNDTLFGAGLYKTWEEYLNKEQHRIPKWMTGFDSSTELYRIRDLDQIHRLLEDVPEDKNDLDGNII